MDCEWVCRVGGTVVNCETTDPSLIAPGVKRYVGVDGCCGVYLQRGRVAVHRRATSQFQTLLIRLVGFRG